MEDVRISNLPAEVTALLDKGKSLSVSSPFTNPDGGLTYFIGEGISAHAVKPLNPVLPERVSQTETLVEPDSFKNYIETFKTPTAICRASLSGNSIEAILDYHGAARVGERDHALTQPSTHRVTLKCPFDIDYAKWRLVFGKGLKQVQFAVFIEDMIHTIGSPPAADLMEAINDLKIDRSVRFKSARNDRDGTVKFTYEEVDAETGKGDSGAFDLPQEVEIITPIFQGGPPVLLKAKLRYELDKGAILLFLSVPGLDKIERDHFRNIGEDVRNSTNTPVFYAA